LFLPLISTLVLAAAGLQGPSAQGIDEVKPSPAVVSGRSPASVVVGSGVVDAGVVQRFEAEVARGLATLAPVFGEPPAHAFFVFLHQDRDGLPAALAPHLHPDSPAFALLGQRQIHILVGEVRRLGTDVRGVVVHELVHELLDQYVAPHGRLIPRWFHEGLAQHLAGDTYLGAREDDLVWRLASRRLLPFGGLRESFPLATDELRVAYAQSYSYVSWLAANFGVDQLLRVARAADRRTSFEAALAGRLDRSTLQLEEGWEHHLLHGSGAPWRVLFDSCFSLSLLAVLPLLVLALMRRLQSEQRAGRRLRQLEQQALAAAAAANAAAEAADAAARLERPADADSGPPATG
jgi:hypothetical protein